MRNIYNKSKLTFKSAIFASMMIGSFMIGTNEVFASNEYNILKHIGYVSSINPKLSDNYDHISSELLLQIEKKEGYSRACSEFCKELKVRYPDFRKINEKQEAVDKMVFLLMCAFYPEKNLDAIKENCLSRINEFNKIFNELQNNDKKLSFAEFVLAGLITDKIFRKSMGVMILHSIKKK